MDTFHYLIVGGGLAGGRAAENIRKLDGEHSIAIVAAEPRRPYQRPPLSKRYLRRETGLERVYLKEEGFYAANSIELITGATATGLDPAARRVALEGSRVLGYEKLLLATGACAWCPPIPGHELPGVYTLRTIEDSEAIRAAATPGARALVVGGSFIGSEAAASLAQLGAQVTLAFRGERLLQRVVPEDLSTLLHAKYRAHDVQIRSETNVKRFEGQERIERVVFEDGTALEVDLVVLGLGVQLNTTLARVAGLQMTEDGAVAVDAYLRTSDPNVYAAGDIAAWPDPTFDRRLRVEHWDVARGQGVRAGRNMAGEDKPYRLLPYFYSDLFDLSFEAWGDLSGWERAVLRGTLKGGSFAFYYFRDDRMVGVLAADRPDAEWEPMQALVRQRPAYEDVAVRLHDDGFDLSRLLSTGGDQA